MFEDEQPRVERLVNRYRMLVRAKALTQDQLEQACRSAVQHNRESSIEDTLAQTCGITLRQIGEALQLRYGAEYVPFRCDRSRIEALFSGSPKYEFFLEKGFVPLELRDEERTLLVLTVDPDPVRDENERTQRTHMVLGDRPICCAVTTRREFIATLDQFFGRPVDADLLDEPAPAPPKAASTEDRWSHEEVDRLIGDAWRLNCSDIHIEAHPKRGVTLVRVRRDGKLQSFREAPIAFHEKLVNMLKHRCGLNSAIRHRPQDGKFSCSPVGLAVIELRVATLPGANGYENVVMRLLGGALPRALHMIGLSPENLSALRALSVKPHGLLLVCGPTGSGKTTTLHSVLGDINDGTRKIWTAENPIEIEQEGLSQTQVDPVHGYTFADALRAFLRADPDVIMVGEIRDAETADIAITASLTGHLVMSTLHTNGAAETIGRLLDMDLDPFLFGDALLGVLAQRLARGLCGKCRVPYRPAESEIKHLLREYANALENIGPWQQNRTSAYQALYRDWQSRFADAHGALTFYRASGCAACSGGYTGRLALHELLVVNPDLRKAIQRKAPATEIQQLGLAAGMRTLRQDGILKVLAGETDLAQVEAVCT